MICKATLLVLLPLTINVQHDLYRLDILLLAIVGMSIFMYVSVCILTPAVSGKYDKC